MIKLHTEHQDGFMVLMHCGVKIGVWMPFMGTKSLKMYMMLVYRLRVIWLIKLCTVHPNVYIQAFYSFYFLVFISLLIFIPFELLWVYLLQIFTRPQSSTWVTKVFKRLVAYTKCNRNFYESELDVQFSFYLCFVRGRAKGRCGDIGCTYI